MRPKDSSASSVYFFFFPLLPLPKALRSAFFALRAALRLQASHRSPGLKGLTALAAGLRSAARPISKFCWRHWYPGRNVNVVSTFSTLPSALVRFVTIVRVCRFSCGCARTIVAGTAESLFGSSDSIGFRSPVDSSGIEVEVGI